MVKFYPNKIGPRTWKFVEFGLPSYDTSLNPTFTFTYNPPEVQVYLCYAGDTVQRNVSGVNSISFDVMFDNFNPIICNTDSVYSYKLAGNVFTNSDLFVTEWIVESGEIFRNDGDTVIHIIWNQDTNVVTGSLSAVITHPYSGCADTISGEVSLLKKPFIEGDDTLIIDVDDYEYLNSNLIYTEARHDSMEWFRNNIRLNVPKNTRYYEAKVPGLYYLIHHSDCGTDTSNAILVKYNCTLSPDFSNTTITSGSISGYNDIIFDGDITISGSVSFAGKDLMMKSGSRIIVPATGAELILNQTQFTGCGLWKGIKVEGGNQPRAMNMYGRVNANTSWIADASIGFYMDQGGYINIDSSVLDNNIFDLVFNDYLIDNSAPFITKNIFGSFYNDSLTCFQDTAMLQFASRGASVLMNGIKVAEMTANKWLNQTDSSYNAIELTVCQDIGVQDNSITGYYLKGIRGRELDGATIAGNDVNNIGALPVVRGDGKTQQGMEFIKSQDLSITGNVFQRCEEGIQFYSSITGILSDIGENAFNENLRGLVLSHHKHPLFATNGDNDDSTVYTNTINVDITCNDFYDNEAGILGGGRLKNQGGKGSSQGASNNFTDNEDWDLVWQTYRDSLHSFKYYEQRTDVFPPPMNRYPNENTPNPTYSLNGETRTTSSEHRDTTATSNICTPSPFVELSISGNDNQSSFKVYPNPFDHFVNIDNNGYQTLHVVVIDLVGKNLTNFSLAPNEKRLWDSSFLSSGLYFVRIANSEGEISTLKIIKAD
jgi:hypothetical protein